MKCPNCGSENNEGAKFCKKCGTPLENKTASHETVINNLNNESTDKTKYIIIALIIVAVVLAGAFAYLYGFGNNSTTSQTPVVENNNSQADSVDNSEPAQATKTSDAAPSTSSSSMSILGGSFSTGGGANDKTYANIYVGPEHSGEAVTVQIFYSRDGATLNNGNMVPKTVNSNGYIEIASADAYSKFPDFAEINLYDNSGKLLDTQSVSLSPEKGTQSF